MIKRIRGIKMIRLNKTERACLWVCGYSLFILFLLSGCTSSVYQKEQQEQYKQQQMTINKNRQLIEEINKKEKEIKRDAFLFCERLKTVKINSHSEYYQFTADLIHKYYECYHKNRINFQLID